MQGTMGKTTGKSLGSSSAGPPDKRRRIDGAAGSSDQLWDDDGCDFTEDQLDNIDLMVACSQQAPSDDPVKLPQKSITRFSTNHDRRSVGRGAGRSLSANAVSSPTSLPKPDVNVPPRPKTSTLSNSGRAGVGAPPGGSHGVIGMGQLTPTAATTGSGKLSPALPSSSNSKGSSALQAELEKLKEQSSMQLHELQKLRDTQYSKDGQIRILRDKMSRMEVEASRQKKEKLLRLENDARERSQREIELDKEVQRLSTRLQFQEKELKDIQSIMKKKERLAGANSCEASTSQSPSSPAFPGVVLPRTTSPRKTPVSPARSPQVTSKRGFPSRESFMSQERSPVKPRVSKAIQVDGDIGGGTTSGSRCRQRSAALHLRHSRGVTSGKELISRLLLPQQPTSEDAGGSAAAVHSITELLYGLDAFHLHLSESPHSASSKTPSDDRVHHSHSSSPDAEALFSSLIKTENIFLARNVVEKLLGSSISDCTSKQSSQMLLEVLPLIDNYVTAYLAQFGANTSTLQEVGHSARTGLGGSGSLVSLEGYMTCSLEVLSMLVKYNPILRNHVMGLNPSEQVAMETDEAVIDPRNRLSEPLLATGAGLIDKLMRLVRPGNSQLDGVLRPGIREKALDILTVLAQSCDPQDLPRFEALLPVVTEFSNDKQPSFELCTKILGVLSVLVRSPTLLSLLCSFNDECGWLRVYSFLTRSQGDYTPHQRTCLASHVLELVGSVASHYRRGLSSLMEASCRCSIHHVRSVVILLHDQYLQLKAGLHNEPPSSNPPPLSAPSTGPTSLRLSVLRRGMSLLHTLSQHDQLFCRHYQHVDALYVELVAGMETVFREGICSVEEDELTALQDLWDLELDPMDLGEDEVDHPSSADHKPPPDVSTIETPRPSPSVKRRGDQASASSHTSHPLPGAGEPVSKGPTKGKGRGLRRRRLEPIEVISVE